MKKSGEKKSKIILNKTNFRAVTRGEGRKKSRGGRVDLNLGPPRGGLKTCFRGGAREELTPPPSMPLTPCEVNMYFVMVTIDK